MPTTLSSNLATTQPYIPLVVSPEKLQGVEFTVADATALAALNTQSLSVGQVVRLQSDNSRNEWSGTAFVAMPALTIMVSGLVADDASAASANLAKIQAALDTGGNVCVSQSGSIYINSTLLIGDNTKLTLGNATRIKLAPNAKCNLLTTKAYAALPVFPTVTWSAGNTASINWPAHPFAIGDYCSLIRANQSEFNGVFGVLAVTDASNFTVTLKETPSTTPTGAIEGRKANVNFDVEGGVWDYDFTNIAGWTGDTTQHAVIIGHAQRFTLRRMAFSHVKKYCVLLGAVRDYEVDHVHALDGGVSFGGIIATTGDIIKVSGPSFNGATRYITGRCSDDMISIHPEEPVGYTQFGFCGGSILGHKISNVGVDEMGGGTIAVYPYTNATHPWRIRGIEIDASFGASAGAHIVIRGDTAGADYAGWVDDVTIRNLMPSGGISSPPLVVDRSVTMNRVRVECNFDNAAYTTAYDMMRLSGKIPLVEVISSANHVQSVVTTTAQTLIDVLNIHGKFLDVVGVVSPNGGTVKTINFHGCDLTSSGSGRNYVYPLSATTIKEINLFGCNTGSACAVIDTGSAALAGIKINLYGGYFNGYKTIGITGHQANVYAAGCVFDCALQGVLRTDGTASVSLYSGGGNTFLNGTALTAGVGSGTLALSLFGWDLPYDVITGVAAVTLATAAGQYLQSTRAGAVNLGPAVRSPAGWVALGTGAAGVNTVIS